MVSRDRGGEDSWGQTGSVCRGAGRLPAAHLPRSRRRNRADHARSRLRRRPRAADGAVLHRSVTRVGGHDRARDGGVRARGLARHERVARDERRGRRHGGGAARGRRGPCGDPAVGQLDATASARSGDADARNGAARGRAVGRRCARREGGGRGGGRVDVLRHRGRPRTRDRRGARRRCDGPPGAVGAPRGPRVVTAEQLAARREQIATAPDLAALLAHTRERAAPLLARLPPIPDSKALLSTDGGVCPEDGAALGFDPWSPAAHGCPRCAKTFSGERHDRHWVRYQHLWLAERAAHLATLAALDGNDAAADRAHEILQAYAHRYFRYPNRDNVLGPSRLFFSTYLESIWIGNYVAAAALLRASGKLDDAAAQDVSRVADEAANLIGEFDEGFSNRQTWNNAALAAIAGWFEDEDLAKRAIEGPTGLLEHLLRGFGRDGTWYEGENYHLFALRGLLIGAAWARLAGVDIFAEPKLAARLRAALLAPARTALPDFTFPARKDARFGVSLAQPAYVELWEVGLAGLGTRETGNGNGEVESWLAAVYQAPAPQPELFESYLHDAPLSGAALPVSRRTLSWWSLVFITHELPSGAQPWLPRSVLHESPGDAVCETFDTSGEWAWVRGRHGEITRAVVAGPGYLLDVVELASRTEHVLELPWHVLGAGEVGPVRWTTGELADEFVSRVEQLVPEGAAPLVLESAVGPRRLRAFLSFAGELVRAEGPGRPRDRKRETFYVVRATGRSARVVTVLEPVGDAASVRSVRVQGSVIEVDTGEQGVHRHAATALGWEITTSAGRVRLAGGRAPEPPLAPLLELDKPTPAVGAALRVAKPPPLDGSLDGFDTSEPLRLELEDQYRRSEEPYAGPDEFAAVAHAAWDDDALYLAVDVVKSELCIRPGGAPPLRLDNEPDDVHSDGLQVYVAGDEGPGDGRMGYVVVPDRDTSELRVRATSDTSGDPNNVRGAWRRTDRGYTVTFAIPWLESGGQRAHVGGRLRFDLVVNEMLPGRTRRAGQLVWSGGNGWVFLQGDRQDPARFGVLELVG